LVKTIDNIGDTEIQEVAIPTGIPIVYKFDKDMKSVPPSKEEDAISQVHMNGRFLEKPGLLKEAMKREDEWSNKVPGYTGTMSRHKTPMTGLERSLYKLAAVRELGEWASEFIDIDAIPEDDGSDGNMGRPIRLTEDEVWQKGMQELESGGQFDPDAPVFHAEEARNTTSGVAVTFNDGTTEEKIGVPLYKSNPCVTSMPSASVLRHPDNVPIRREGVIVIIRHGKTQHNKLGLFTGWEDAPLADEGIEEAKQAGKLLKMHGFEFDVVYTSWLSRALETALYVMDEMDALWLPTVKTWRLNERMYGELTGLSKQMVKQRHGEKQFKAWRRGFNVRPPPVSSFSQHYPGNDPRYQKYLKDRRISFRETMIRSIEKGRPVIQRKLPKTESLKDCMDRTIPYFKERIAKDAVNQGKRVLISSSENAIRGLLMHLCEIPEEEITGLEIPNGLPLIFDVKSKCLKLLDDGTGRDPLEVYNFGKAAKYLFRPCKNEDGSPDEVRIVCPYNSVWYHCARMCLIV
jgi:2,3-bisphosphoglycerate-dependent phosphoglycerate mutase